MFMAAHLPGIIRCTYHYLPVASSMKSVRLYCFSNLKHDNLLVLVLEIKKKYTTILLYMYSGNIEK